MVRFGRLSWVPSGQAAPAGGGVPGGAPPSCASPASAKSSSESARSSSRQRLSAHSSSERAAGASGAAQAQERRSADQERARLRSEDTGTSCPDPGRAGCETSVWREAPLAQRRDSEIFRKIRKEGTEPELGEDY